MARRRSDQRPRAPRRPTLLLTEPARLRRNAPATAARFWPPDPAAPALRASLAVARWCAAGLAKRCLHGRTVPSEAAGHFRRRSHRLLPFSLTLTYTHHARQHAPQLVAAHATPLAITTPVATHSAASRSIPSYRPSPALTPPPENERFSEFRSPSGPVRSPPMPDSS